GGLGEVGDEVDGPVGDHRDVDDVADGDHRVHLVDDGVAVLELEVDGGAQLAVDEVVEGVLPQSRRDGAPQRGHRLVGPAPARGALHRADQLVGVGGEAGRGAVPAGDVGFDGLERDVVGDER